jgi:hypothetical protein
MDDDNIARVICEHLSYEISMLTMTNELLNKNIDSEIVRNALFESFCIHARQILDFLNNKQGTKVNSIADEEFLATKSTEAFAKYDRKINTQIAHLTLIRNYQANDRLNNSDRMEILSSILADIQSLSNHIKNSFQKYWNININNITNYTKGSTNSNIVDGDAFTNTVMLEINIPSSGTILVPNRAFATNHIIVHTYTSVLDRPHEHDLTHKYNK